MTSYRTCTNCTVDRETCVRLAQVKAAIAGSAITSVKFRCADRVPLYQPGDRVVTTWTVAEQEDGYYGDGSCCDETWPATVIKESGAKFVIQVDDVESDEGTGARFYFKNSERFAKASVARLKKLDEPRLTVCALCDCIAERGLKDCTQEGMVRRPECLKEQAEPVEAANA